MGTNTTHTLTIADNDYGGSSSTSSTSPGGTFVVVDCSSGAEYTIDDYNQYVSSKSFDYLMKVSSPQTALEVYKAEFDAMWEFGGLWICVWHPAVSGRPAQSIAIRKLLDHMKGKENVWFATHQEVADHANSLIENKKWKPRVERIPFYNKPILK